MFYNSHKHKLSYLLIPKCGSTSIQQALESSEKEKTEKPEYKSFTVVRPPLDRFYSGYNELIKREIFKGTPQQLLFRIEKEGFFDAHIKPQTHYLKPVDQLYSFDTVHELGLNLKHENKGLGKIKTVNINLLYDLYENDFIMWENFLFE